MINKINYALWYTRHKNILDFHTFLCYNSVQRLPTGRQGLSGLSSLSLLCLLGLLGLLSLHGLLSLLSLLSLLD